jgi:hypothetical protein
MLTLTDSATGNSFPLTPGKMILPPGVLRENGRYVIDAQASGKHAFRLLVSDEEIEPKLSEFTPMLTHVRWVWQVTEYAGEAILSLFDNKEPLLECILDISPHPGKLGSEAYSELLADLQEKAEGLLFGITAAHVHLVQEEADVPPMARFALLRAYFPRLEKAFRAIVDTPHRALVAEREERVLHKVRRVDTRSLQVALKRMPVLTALRMRDVPAASALPTLDVPRREHSFNTSPNRHVLALLGRLVGLCSDLNRRFEMASQNNNSEGGTSSRAARWALLSERFREKLDRFRWAEFLTGLKPSRPDSAALMTISRHPAYSQFDRLARTILNPHVALGEDADVLLSLRPTYDIYEYWCFFQVAEAIQQAMPNATWTHHIKIAEGNLLFSLRAGTCIEGTDGNRTFRLIFQKSYGANCADSQAFSISKNCIPDIVLEIDDESRRRVVILDAKYRSSEDSIHSALSDIHVYRDAIRESLTKSAIYAAFILTPAHSAATNRYFTDEYRKAFRFGGFDLSPRNAEQLATLVTAVRELAEC